MINICELSGTSGSFGGSSWWEKPKEVVQAWNYACLLGLGEIRFQTLILDR